MKLKDDINPSARKSLALWSLSLIRHTPFARWSFALSQFDILLPVILRHEGVSPTNPTGYANIPGDPGGETNWGISQREWDLLHSRFADFPPDVKSLTQDQASTIYKTVYYLPVFDELPPGPALVCFDCQVNESLGGIRLLQRAFNLTDDGIWGPDSERALRLALRNVPALTEDLLWQRLRHYDEISRSNPVNESFIVRLWIPRLLQCRTEAKTL